MNMFIQPKVESFLENGKSNLQWIAESDEDELGIYDTWYDYCSIDSTELGTLMSVSVFDETYQGTNRPHYLSSNRVVDTETGEEAAIENILNVTVHHILLRSSFPGSPKTPSQ